MRQKHWARFLAHGRLHYRLRSHYKRTLNLDYCWPLKHIKWPPRRRPRECCSRLRLQANCADEYPRECSTGQYTHPSLRPMATLPWLGLCHRLARRCYIQNIKAGVQPIVIDAHGPRTLIMLSPDGKYIVIPDSEVSVRVWEAATGRSVAGPLNLGREFISHILWPPWGGIGSDD